MVGAVASAMVGTNADIVKRIAKDFWGGLRGNWRGNRWNSHQGSRRDNYSENGPAPAETTDETTDKTIARAKVRRLDLALAAILVLIAGAVVVLAPPDQRALATWIGLAIFVAVIVVVGYRLMGFEVILLPVIVYMLMDTALLFFIVCKWGRNPRPTGEPFSTYHWRSTQRVKLD